MLRFNLEVDPFKSFSGLATEDMLELAQNSTSNGYNLFYFPIIRPTQEEIDTITSLSKSALQANENIFINPSESISITICESNNISELDITTISDYEATFFDHFYQAIDSEQLISFRGSPAFVKKCKKNIKKLLMRPIGRDLLLTIYRTGIACILEQGKHAHVGSYPENNEIATSCCHIFLPVHSIYYGAEIENGIRGIRKLPFHILIAHEMLHCIQKISLLNRARTLKIGESNTIGLFSHKSSDRYFPDLIEKITILGVENLIPCENSFHFQFSTKPCFTQAYFSSPAISIKREKNSLSAPSLSAKTQIAASYGLTEEVLKLLEEGGNLDEALEAARSAKEHQLVEFLERKFKITDTSNPSSASSLEKAMKNWLQYLDKTLLKLDNTVEKSASTA